MYTFKSIFILITALSAGALPLLCTATPTISPRDVSDGHPGCIGRVSGHVDDHCIGDLVPGVSAPDGTTVLPTAAFNGSQDRCITFNTPADHINVEWGCFIAILSFPDAHCGASPGDTIRQFRPFEMGKGRQTCFEKKSLGNMGSFMFR